MSESPLEKKQRKDVGGDGRVKKIVSKKGLGLLNKKINRKIRSKGF